jgi:glycosyltransferase involved in cell wall biosynthesis
MHALAAMLTGVEKHCPQYACAVFEDCGQRDNTADVLQKGREPQPVPHLMATEYVVVNSTEPPSYPNVQVFMGDRNLGVAGNSNRALKWFMDGDWDHLLLCNDDLFVLGDFADLYARAHTELDVGLFCFCDFTKASPAISGAPETYKWTTYPVRGWKVKFLPRFTGIMMSVTRKTVEAAGYFDTSFGQFGEEHCDWTIRCRLAGGIKLNGQDMNCLDIDHGLLRHQDVETSMPRGAERQQADAEASCAMQEAARSYTYRHYCRPFRLVTPVKAGGYRGGGIPVQRLLECGYNLVTDLV